MCIYRLRPRRTIPRARRDALASREHWAPPDGPSHVFTIHVIIIRTRICVCVCVCVCVYISAPARASREQGLPRPSPHGYTRTYGHIYIYVYIHIYIYISIFIRTCICVCIYRLLTGVTTFHGRHDVAPRESRRLMGVTTYQTRDPWFNPRGGKGMRRHAHRSVRSGVRLPIPPSRSLRLLMHAARSTFADSN